MYLLIISSDFLLGLRYKNRLKNRTKITFFKLYFIDINFLNSFTQITEICIASYNAVSSKNYLKKSYLEKYSDF